VLGGVLTQAAGWHWIIFVNVPIGILAGLSAVRVLDADRGTGLQGGADWLEALLVTAGLMLSTRSSEPPGTAGSQPAPSWRPPWPWRRLQRS
jgi:MFS family permease